MSNVLKGLKFAVAVLLFCGVVGMAITIWHKGKDAEDSGNTRLLEVTTDVSMEDLVQNTGKDISGALVVTLAEKYHAVLPIVIATGEVPGGFYDVSYIREVSNSQYVNPNKMFRLTIDRNVNDDPEALVFVQSGCSKPDYDLDKAIVYVQKSQMLFNKLIAERNLQENLALYESTINEFADANYKVIVKKNQQQTKEYWLNQGDQQRELYEENSKGLK